MKSVICSSSPVPFCDALESAARALRCDSRAISRALSPRPAEVHVHLDEHGEYVCEDPQCPSVRPKAALEPLPFGTLHHRGLRR